MISSYVSMHEKGAITAHHLIVQSIQMIDPTDAGLILDDFPKDLLEQMLEYINNYQSNPMISNYGAMPTTNQVQAAETWIENDRSRRHRQQEEEKARNLHLQIEKRPIGG